MKIRLYLGECYFLEDEDFQELAVKTDGLSGSDIANACQTALGAPSKLNSSSNTSHNCS
jgi:SpoVK/Ycf46/Vps4 family AAA+-type ATPase